MFSSPDGLKSYLHNLGSCRKRRQRALELPEDMMAVKVRREFQELEPQRPNDEDPTARLEKYETMMDSLKRWFNATQEKYLETMFDEHRLEGAEKLCETRANRVLRAEEELAQREKDLDEQFALLENRQRRLEEMDVDMKKREERIAPLEELEQSLSLFERWNAAREDELDAWQKRLHEAESDLLIRERAVAYEEGRHHMIRHSSEESSESEVSDSDPDPADMFL